MALSLSLSTVSVFFNVVCHNVHVAICWKSDDCSLKFVYKYKTKKMPEVPNAPTTSALYWVITDLMKHWEAHIYVPKMKPLQ